MARVKFLLSAVAFSALAPIAAWSQSEPAEAPSLEQYRALVQELETLERYNEVLTKQIAAQEAVIAGKQSDGDGIDELKRSIRLLLEDMAANYAQFVQDDIPFDVAERAARVARYQGQLSAADADENIAQNFRLLLEGLQIEIDAGRAIDIETQPYTDENGVEVLDEEGKPELTEYLRVGRIAYVRINDKFDLFQAWNQSTRTWVDLPSSYKPDVQFALRVAREEAAPDIMFIPVTAPVSE